jgi:glycosyltransferase involved in cell wall biosynthesis
VRLGINGRFLHAPVTGVQRFAHEVVPRLCQRNEAVLLVPRGSPVPAEWRDLAGVSEGRLAGHIWEQVELPARARTARCDVMLHLSGTAPLRGGPHVTAIHDVLPLTQPGWFAPRFAAWYRFLLPRAAARSACIITVSEAARAAIVETLGVPAARVRVAPQGVAPFDGPASAVDVRRVREIYGLPPSFILAVGAGDPRKNIGFLEDVLERWRARDGGAPALIVVGEAARHVHAHGQVRDHDGTRAIGRVSDAELRALYTTAAAFAFPSLAEGFGRPPLEALACGTPAVVADYPAAREVLGDEARIVPLDPETWIDALRAAVTEDDAAGAAARGARIVARWRWEDAVAAVLAACRAALESTGRVAA